jgi:hypothetical protein
MQISAHSASRWEGCGPWGMKNTLEVSRFGHSL